MRIGLLVGQTLHCRKERLLALTTQEFSADDMVHDTMDRVMICVTCIVKSFFSILSFFLFLELVFLGSGGLTR